LFIFSSCRFFLQFPQLPHPEALELDTKKNLIEPNLFA